MDRKSYALGASIGMNINANHIIELINCEDFIAGIKDFLSGDLKLDNSEIETLMDALISEASEREKAAKQQESEINLTKGIEYMKENAKKFCVQTTASGLQYKIEQEGNGKMPHSHSTVLCHYEGKTIDGKVFDSSWARNTPAKFGLDRVIQGWTEGLQLMKEGSVFTFTIPPHLAYGDNGIPGAIGRSSVLVFKVELIEVID